MPAPRAAIFTRVAIYNRISNDPQGIEAGVERQREDCEALAGRLGWQVAKTYVDNDLSAWSGKRRPDYQQMLDDIRAGKVDAVIVWHEDRLTRLPRELEEFADTCLKAGVHRLVSCYGDTDLSNSDDMLTLRIKGAVAKNQSDAASRRLRRKHLELAQSGRPNGGRRPYGYEGAVHDAHGQIINRDRAYKAVVPAEAERIKEAAERVLAGESMRSVAKDWNEQEVPTSNGGGLWNQGNLKRILVSPRIAGLREHKAKTYPASWEAIITPEQHELLTTLLTDPARRTKPKAAGRKYLLSGLLTCGKCGRLLFAKNTAKDRVVYACRIMGGPRGGCGGVQRRIGVVDEFVTEAVLSALESPELAEGLRVDSADHVRVKELVAEIKTYEARVQRAADACYVRDRISEETYLATAAQLEAMTAQARGELRRLALARAVTVLPEEAITAADIRREWHRRDLAWQRAVIRGVTRKITLYPQGRGRHPFNPDKTLKIQWADRPVEPADDPRDQDPELAKSWEEDDRAGGPDAGPRAGHLAPVLGS
jgi:site-specific DNA recombinase